MRAADVCQVKLHAWVAGMTSWRIMSKHKWALDIVERVIDWCTVKRAWVVVRERHVPADPANRCRCGKTHYA